jgi:hypothetical protein
MDVTAELIKLYSSHSTRDIEAGGGLLLGHFQVDSPEALLALDGYKEAFALVSGCAVHVDKLAASYLDVGEQVRESIRLIRRMIDDGEIQKKIDTTRTLLEGKLYGVWPAEQRAVYDKKKEILEWRDFFVSYTNRDAPATNNQFKQLIKSCLGKIPAADENQSNFLAKVVTRHLRRYQNLTGFFDEESLEIGESIQEEVNKYCTRAFALVQIIEPLTLEKQPPRNWCFHEYTHFSGNPAVTPILGNRHRHFFLVAGAKFEDVRPANIIALYEDWVDRIADVKYIALQNERNSTLRSKIQTIAGKILTLRAEIINAWLHA